MVHVYICEDNPKQLELLKRYIEGTIIIEELDMKVVLATTDPHAVLANAQEDEEVGAYFLDIDLKSDIDGLRLAQQLRRLDPRCYIVFITTHSEMSYLTFQYKVEALDFIIKDQSSQIRNRVTDCLMNIMQKHHSSQNKISKNFCITLGSHSTYVPLEQIQYFETAENLHRIYLHTADRRIEFTGQMKDVMLQLDHRFYRCHRSYIINTDQIAAVDYDNNIIEMQNSEKCPLAIRMKKGLKKMQGL